MTEENQGPYVETLFGKVVTKIQDQALLLSKYFYQSAQSETEYQKEIEELLIKYHPLMQVDGERKLIFEQASIQEFFVASRIEEEINHDFAYGNSFPRKNLLLNQRMLSGESLTFEFLVDAVQNKKITAEALLRIIKSSKREYQSESNDQNSALNLGSESSCKEEIRTTTYKQSYVIEASNAISILNAAGYDFTNIDLSSIQLLNANLSFGIFKGANLTNADLTGANFRDVWLENADLTNSKLTKVQFEAFSGKIFKKSVSSNPIAYSKNGNLMAVMKGEKIVILERDCALRTSFKKKSTLSVHNEAISDCVFSPDGEKFIFVGMDGVLCISDVINSEQQSTLILEREKARGGFGKRYKLSADGKYVLFTGKGEPMMMWEVGKTVPVLKLKPKRTTFVGSELSSDSILILVSESDSTCSIWNARMGKKIHRLERPSPLNELVKLSFNSKQTLHVLSGNLFSMRDLVRNHSTKFLETIDRGCFLHQYSFSDDCKQIIFLTQNKIHFQDVASGKYLRSLQCREKLPAFTNPSFKLIANAAQLALADNNIIVFFELTCPETGSIRKGPNTKGLSLDGTNIDACTDISQEVLQLFSQKSDYRVFSNNTINNLILHPDPKSITRISITDSTIGDLGFKIIGRDRQWVNLEAIELKCHQITDASVGNIHDNMTWSKLKLIDFSHNSIGNKGVIALAENNCWTQLEVLLLNSNLIDDIGIVKIVDKTVWKMLKKLNLGFNKIGDEGTIAIAKNTIWEKLEELYLYYNRCKDCEILNIFSSNPTWTYLQILDLQGNPLGFSEKDIKKLLFSKILSNLRSLKLHNSSFDDSFLIHLRNPSVENVTELTLKNEDISALHTAIINSCDWINLKILDLSDNRISNLGAAKIGENLTWVNLEELKLASNRIGDDGGAAIGVNCIWEKLKLLDLYNNNIGLKSVSAISQNPSWKDLRVLNLGYNMIGDEGVIELNQNIIWTNLQRLHLESNKISSKGVEMLSKNTAWLNLQYLNLSDNLIEAEGVIELSKNSTWNNLTTLELSENAIKEIGLAAIWMNTAWKNLHMLNVANTKIDCGVIAKLSKTVDWPHLRTLNLSNNKINDCDTAELSKNDTWKNLESLELERVSLDSQGIVNLASNQSWSKLKVINLNNSSNLGEGGAASLSQNRYWTNLEIVKLGWSQITAKGVSALSKNTTWLNLKKLELNENGIGDKGATDLGANTTWTNLQSLNLLGNWIGDLGASGLAKNSSWKKLNELNLQSNSIGDSGAKELSQNSAWTDLHVLYLGWNNIKDSGIRDLGMNQTWSNLQELCLYSNQFTGEGVSELAKNSAWKN